MANSINIGGGAGGSGSSVIPNPQGAATDTLVKLGIEGTIYDFAGGGSGSSYSETTLWSGSETPSTSGTHITLSDNISNYDEIAFVMDTDYVGSNSFLVSQLEIGETYIATIYAPSNYGAYWSYDSDTQITIKSQASASLKTYTKVIGIKYGGGSGHNYSTTEQVVGTWIDGSTIYEKTYTSSTYYYSTATVILDLSSLAYDKIISLQVESELTIAGEGSMHFMPSSDNAYISTNKKLYAKQSLAAAQSGRTMQSYITIRYTKSST